METSSFKKCKNCLSFLPMTEFYKHKGMGDGHLSFCKECVKSRVRAHTAVTRTDDKWLEKERARCRVKEAARYHRLKQEYSFQQAKKSSDGRYYKKHKERINRRAAMDYVSKIEKYGYPK